MLAVSVLVHDCHWVPHTPVTRGGRISAALRFVAGGFLLKWKTYGTNKLKKVLLVGYGEMEA